MTYKLPFGLKAKPLSHKFEHGSVRFSMDEGTMHYDVWYIKRGKPMFSVIRGIVKDKTHLDYLLSVKEFPIKIQALEIVS